MSDPINMCEPLDETVRRYANDICALRGEVARLRGARSADDVREMLCEASCVDVTPERCARIWSLLEHPATTMTTLAVIADERGESYAKVKAENDTLRARIALLDSAVAARDARIAHLEGRVKAGEGLLGDARKCVSLVNQNGYYDGWLARCDALLRPSGGAGGEVK